MTASVFFSSDVANPDTYGKFYCDIQMYTHHDDAARRRDLHEPVHLVGGLLEGEQWQGRNITRWTRGVRQLFRASEASSTGQERGDVHPLNDLAVNNQVVIRWCTARAPPRSRAGCGPTSAVGNRHGRIKDWFREG